MSETNGERDRAEEIRDLRQHDRENDGVVAGLRLTVALLSEKVTNLEKRTDGLCNEQNNFIRREDWTPEKYVTQKEWEPVKMIAYGMVGTILLAVLGALIGLVVTTRS